MLRRTVLVACICTLVLAMTPLAESAKTAEPVDVNRASLSELMRVPGITEVWARRIIRFRPYRTKLDLLDQGVVSAEVYQRIRDAVVAHRGPSRRGDNSAP